MNVRGIAPVLECAARRANQVTAGFDIRRRRVERSRESDDYRIAHPALGADAAIVAILNRVSAERRTHARQHQQRCDRAQCFSIHVRTLQLAKRIWESAAPRALQSYHAGHGRDWIILAFG